MEPENAPTSLTAVFLSSIPEELATHAQEIPQLEEKLQTLQGHASQTWPQFALSPQQFTELLGQKILQSPPRKGLENWLDNTQAADLLLAHACATHQPGSIETFEKHFASDVRKLVMRYQGPKLPADDLQQSLREKIFVATHKRAAKINDYSGQGYLQNWLRVTGTRAFIDMLRSSSRSDKESTTREEDRIMQLPDIAQDLELDYLKQEYRAEFKDAFAVAAQTLSSRERNLLRQHLVAGLTVAQLGKIYGVHAATAARHVAKARENLVAATRAELMRRLKISHSEFESIMKLIRSRIDLSISRLLHTNPNLK